MRGRKIVGTELEIFVKEVVKIGMEKERVAEWNIIRNFKSFE